MRMLQNKVDVFLVIASFQSMDCAAYEKRGR